MSALLTETDEAVAAVAHNWIGGIGISILGSIIGGASKLSIRKSWILDAKRREQLHCYQLDRERRSDIKKEVEYDLLGGDRNKKVETNCFAPLKEVSGSSSLTASLDLSRQESFSDEEPFETLTDFNAGILGGDQPSTVSYYASSFSSWLFYLLGMVGMSFLNPLCCILAMRVANPSILAPFSGLSLVWVTLFSPATLGEHPGRSQQVACGLIILGEILVAVFGDHSNEGGRGLDDVIASYQGSTLQAFILLMTLFIVQLGIFIWVCPLDSVLRKVAWGSVGGSIMGFQNFHKDALTIYDTIQENNLQDGGEVELETVPATLYLFVFAAVSVAFAGLLGLAACMKRYDATYSVAMFVVSYVLSASLMSSVHYRTFDHLEGGWNYVLYPLGLATVFLGAYVLVRPEVLDEYFDCRQYSDEARQEDTPVLTCWDSMPSGGGDVSYERKDASYGDNLLLNEKGVRMAQYPVDYSALWARGIRAEYLPSFGQAGALE